jgi:hypothetical protein
MRFFEVFVLTIHCTNYHIMPLGHEASSIFIVDEANIKLCCAED